MVRRKPGVRASNHGSRLDNPHRRSYLRFATAAFQMFDAFLGDVTIRPEAVDDIPAPLRPAWIDVRTALREHRLKRARRELMTRCPSLSENQLQALAPFVAHTHSLLAGIDRSIAFSEEDNRQQPGAPRARTPIPHTLVGCAWLNAPAEITAAQANAYLDDYFQNGVPDNEADDCPDRYRRSRKAFVEFIYAQLLDGVSGRGQLIAPADIWRLPSKIELAIRTVWARPDIAARRTKFHRDVGRESDVGDFARHLAWDGQLHALIWRAMKDNGDIAALNPHAIAEFGAAALRIQEDVIRYSRFSEDQRAAILAQLPPGQLAWAGNIDAGFQHAALAVLKAEQARRPTEAHGAPD